MRSVNYGEDVVFHGVGNEEAKTSDAIERNDLINCPQHDSKLPAWDVMRGKGWGRIAHDHPLIKQTGNKHDF